MLAELLIRSETKHNSVFRLLMAESQEAGMWRVKRTAISLKPKQPYLDWANSLEAGGVTISLPDHASTVWGA